MIKFIKSLFKPSLAKPKYIAEPDDKGTYYIVERSKFTGEYTSVVSVNVKKEDIEKTVKMLERKPIEIYINESGE